MYTAAEWLSAVSMICLTIWIGSRWQSSQNKRSCWKYQAGRLVYHTHRLFVCLFGYGACKCPGVWTNVVSSVQATIIGVWGLASWPKNSTRLCGLLDYEKLPDYAVWTTRLPGLAVYRPTQTTGLCELESTCLQNYADYMDKYTTLTTGICRVPDYRTMQTTRLCGLDYRLAGLQAYIEYWTTALCGPPDYLDYWPTGLHWLPDYTDYWTM